MSRLPPRSFFRRRQSSRSSSGVRHKTVSRVASWASHSAMTRARVRASLIRPWYVRWSVSRHALSTERTSDVFCEAFRTDARRAKALVTTAAHTSGGKSYLCHDAIKSTLPWNKRHLQVVSTGSRRFALPSGRGGVGIVPSSVAHLARGRAFCARLIAATPPFLRPRPHQFRAQCAEGASLAGGSFPSSAFWRSACAPTRQSRTR